MIYNEYLNELKLSDYVLTFKNLKNMNFKGAETGDYDHDKMLKIVDSCKSTDDVQYLRRDLSAGFTQLDTLANNIDKANANPGSNKPLEARIKKGLTSKKVKDHKVWLQTVYRKKLTEKYNELKKG